MTTIHVAHSPDSDDAFMFYALAAGKIDTGEITYVHELQDIESLNKRAMRGELEVSAVSIHAYAYLSDRYALLPHGASMGDRYGPRLVGRRPMGRKEIRGRRIAIPGTLTSAYLALRLFEPDFAPVPTPSSACTSTSGRSTTASVGAKRFDCSSSAASKAASCQSLFKSNSSTEDGPFGAPRATASAAPARTAMLLRFTYYPG